MAKNGVTLGIVMLIIGMSICSANSESYNTIVEYNDVVFKNVYMVSPMMINCLAQCHNHHPHNPEKKKNCNKECCDIECHEWIPHHNEKFDECIKKLYDLYVS
ncbi:hypothetical protein PIB30_003617 [Stylosanthes scabra]|uniref:Uncharacterized protein n=1 Tax=Stylosanthes scabra TaxID=79078 RepID=A0ABU6Y3V3_9FABA|nr:hypothetical protein [Stylosanthes scabra]